MMTQRESTASMNQTLHLALALAAGLIGGLASRYVLPIPVHAQAKSDSSGILRVRGLIVEDQNGHERARLGAPLPDPTIHGIRRKRVGSISGLTISDADGNERGGYVTGDRSGEAFFTLDSEDEQQLLFLANRKGGVNFNLFDSKGNGAQILVFPSGPKFTLRRAKETVLEMPR